MKKYFLALFSVILICGLILISSCSTSGPSPSTTPLPAPSSSAAPAPTQAPIPTTAPSPPQITTATSAPAKVITLKYNDQNSEAFYQKEWIKAVETATGGRVKFETYYNQTLSKGVDAWEATKNGIADVSWCYPGYWTGLCPITMVVNLPFINYQSSEQASEIMWNLYQKFPSIQAEWKDNKILILWASGINFLSTTNKQVKTLEDLKGLKLRIQGGPQIEAAKLLGISPVMIPMPDVYLSLQKGVVEGISEPWEALYNYKHYESIKYITYTTLWTPFHVMAVNWNTWNSIPADIQKQIESVSGLSGAKMWGKNEFDWYVANAPALIKQKGYELTMYNLPSEENLRWQQIAGKPIWDNWIKEMNTAGHPEAQQILDTLVELVKTTKP